MAMTVRKRESAINIFLCYTVVNLKDRKFFEIKQVVNAYFFGVFMRIQYVSDLHLDHSNVELNVAGADVVVLAGDISSSPLYTADWIRTNIGEKKPVIYVAGNHEYDYHDIQSQDFSIMSALIDLPNVRFLENSSVVIDGVKFIGSTLWTGFDAFPEMGNISAMRALASRSISDFHTISNGNKNFTPEDASGLYHESKSYIFGELTKPFDGKRVVVTHFPPSRQCVHKMYRGNLLNPYFIANAEDLVIKSDLWIHGHTHSTVDKNVAGVKVLCNPRGYSRFFNMSENPAWNPNKIVKI